MRFQPPSPSSVQRRNFSAAAGSSLACAGSFGATDGWAVAVGELGFSSAFVSGFSSRSNIWLGISLANVLA